ncbi:MAG: hypothetical protein H7287_05330 [Thermoleophilia bacterium]|nr:hypothetical protein [Thermoleophilia bacterium]
MNALTPLASARPIMSTTPAPVFEKRRVGITGQRTDMMYPSHPSKDFHAETRGSRARPSYASFSDAVWAANAIAANEYHAGSHGVLGRLKPEVSAWAVLSKNGAFEIARTDVSVDRWHSEVLGGFGHHVEQVVANAQGTAPFLQALVGAQVWYDVRSGDIAPYLRLPAHR